MYIQHNANLEQMTGIHNITTVKHLIQKKLLKQVDA